MKNVAGGRTGSLRRGWNREEERNYEVEKRAMKKPNR
jgi:hypothetical protein